MKIPNGERVVLSRGVVGRYGMYYPAGTELMLLSSNMTHGMVGLYEPGSMTRALNCYEKDLPDLVETED